MPLLTPQQQEKLHKNGSPDQRGQNHFPVVRLFLANTACTWLLTDVDLENPDIAFGLCDLGLGYPELGSVSIWELENLTLRGFKVERDLHFEARYPILVYWEAARMVERARTDEELLKRATVSPSGPA